jgi:hypothetical protein
MILSVLRRTGGCGSLVADTSVAGREFIEDTPDFLKRLSHICQVASPQNRPWCLNRGGIC